MQEDTIWRSLEKFDVPSYIRAAREHGRTALDPEIRLRAASLYEMVREHTAGGSFLSRDLRAALGLVERALFSEHFFLRHPVPRYRAYANIPVLSWVLCADGRAPLSEVRSRCWAAIRLLMRDLISFEVCSLARVERWQQRRFDPARAAERIDRLGSLLKMVQGGPVTTYVHLEEPPAAWSSYSLEPARTAALLHLTAFPQTEEHDEVLFLRTIHIAECCFWGVLSATVAAIDYVQQSLLDVAARRLREATAFARILLPLFQALRETMPPAHFAGFRDATGEASAVQSRSHQLMEIHLQGLDMDKARILADIPELTDLLQYQHKMSLRDVLRFASAADSPGVMALMEEAHELYRARHAWMAYHLGIARGYLPSDMHGTGGTRGASYLEARYKRALAASHQYGLPPMLPDISLCASAQPLLCALY